MRSARETYANAKVQSSPFRFRRLYKRITPYCSNAHRRAVVTAGAARRTRAPPGDQRRAADDRSRQRMDGQRNGDAGAGGSGCDTVARAFVDYYYHTFDANRAALATLYGQTSMLSFEGHSVAGAEEIGRKLAQLPFEQCRHSICTVDCQPSPSFPGSILVFVSGNLQLAGEEHQLRFSQMFQLVPNEQGSFFVQNDIFRLNYG